MNEYILCGFYILTSKPFIIIHVVTTHLFDKAYAIIICMLCTKIEQNFKNNKFVDMLMFVIFVLKF